METYSSPGEEIEGTEDIIRLSDVKERLGNIRPFFAEDKRDLSYSPDFATIKEAEGWIAGKPEKDREHFWVCVNGHEDDEQVALKALLDETGEPDLLTPNGHDPRYLVNEGSMDDFAREEGSDWGVGTDHPLYDFVDWDRLGRSLMQDMTRIIFRGTAFYTRG